jgi:hypothetical protein
MKASPCFLCACVLLGLFVVTTVTAHNLVSARLARWSEVTTFTGTGNTEYQNTTDFAVNYTEWRIRWEYTTDPSYTRAAGFFVWVYQQGQTGYVDFFSDVGGYNTNGTSYVENRTGTFYMTILARPPAVTGTTLIVEQNLESVPEFPPSTVLPLTLTVTLFVAAALSWRKQVRKGSDQD